MNVRSPCLRAEDSYTVHNAICIFEQDTGMPYHRHFAPDPYGGTDYAGLLKTVLTIRSIATVGNYDYIYDYYLHLGGDIGSTVSLSGCARTPKEGTGAWGELIANFASACCCMM